MKVLIGVTGSIAAFKACEVVSELRKAGVDVSVIMTEHATNLIGPATFRALTGKPVRVALFEESTGRPLHIELAVEHGVVAIVPATANIIGKARAGICDDLLSTVILSTKAPVIFAPAMNEAMYLAEAVQENIEALKARGYIFVEPEIGWLACGTEGKGRLASVERIVSAILDAGAMRGDLKGKKIIITGGPTRESIDSIRFITNRSSGKMAISLARVARRRGAETALICGPICLEPPAGVRSVSVETADEMRQAIENEWQDADCLIMAAAVCDFKPKQGFEGKLRRQETLKLDLISTEDVVASFGAKKGKRVVVGFAVETEDEVTQGRKKLEEKNLDLIFVNNPLKEGSHFGSDTNSGYLIDSKGNVQEFSTTTKLDLSEKILDAVSALLSEAR